MGVQIPPSAPIPKWSNVSGAPIAVSGEITDNELSLGPFGFSARPSWRGAQSSPLLAGPPFGTGSSAAALGTSRHRA